MPRKTYTDVHQVHKGGIRYAVYKDARVGLQGSESFAGNRVPQHDRADALRGSITQQFFLMR